MKEIKALNLINKMWGDKEYENEYQRIHIHTQKLMKACQQHIIIKGLLHKGLTHEEIQKEIEKYKMQYALRKKKKEEKKAIEEAKRRYQFIYG